MKLFDSNAKYQSNIMQCRVTCKCTHTIYMAVYDETAICRYCGRTVKNDSLARFKYMLDKQGVKTSEVNA